MRFTTREDIAADPARVFAALTDFQGFERAAVRRGAEIVRLDRLAAPGAGMSWQGSIPWRGKARRFVGELRDFTPHAALAWHAESGGFRLVASFALLPLAKGRTRLAVDLEVKPGTLAARLKLQAVRLQKQRLNARFRQRVRVFAETIERGN